MADTNILPKINIKSVLVGLLVIASFFIGSLWTKARLLEKGTAVPGTPTVATITNQPNQPQDSAPGQRVQVNVGHLPVKGNKNAKVTIVEFGDFRCPFCERFFKDTEPQLMKDYIDTGKAKFAFRHYQFLGPASVLAGNAAECANEQNKFWKYHDYLYQNQPDESDTSMYTTDKLTEIAGNLGMNTDQFKSCLDNKKYDKNVSDDLSAGQQAGVTGTPTTFINGLMVGGAQPYSVFKTIIDQELAK